MTIGTNSAPPPTPLPPPKSFFDLPPHLRTRIYTHLILHTPLSTSSTLQQFHEKDPYQRLFRHSASIAEAKIERLIHYPSRIYLPFEGLLRTNRTIRSEIKKVLRALRREDVDCRLDLIVERGRNGGGGVWPSWLICPLRNPNVRRLEIDVRVFGDDFSIHGSARRDIKGPVMLREFEGGSLAFEHAHVGRERCRTLAFAIVAVIARFIERGARWGHVRDEISIETLVLNFTDVGREGNEKGEETFLELPPPTPTSPNMPTPPSDCTCASPDDYWDIDTLVAEADEAMTFALGDRRYHSASRYHSDNRYHNDTKTTLPPSTDEDESIHAPELLRMVDLVLKPLCREEKYMLHRRKHHFSAVHLALLRRNVGKVVIELGGRLKRRMKVVGS